MELEINAKLASLAPGAGPASERAVALAEMFGIGLDERHEVTLYEGFRVKVRRGDVVYITGPSGCGKTVLLREMERKIKKALDLRLKALGAAEKEEEAAEDPEGPVAALESVD
jgi:ABC-type ATPase with predicted acetyltransferase domain